ncbi:MAG: MFS transporter [Kiloniellales bacterium]
MLQRFRFTLGAGEAAWLGAGYLLALSSSFGQTFFISLSGGALRQLLDLSHGGFGGLYTIATAGSALVMLWAGGLADRPRLGPFAVWMLLGLVLACLTMATTASVWQLLLALFLLRVFGQGMLSHVGMTAMARWFERRRGRAISIASLGYPSGEALLPSLAVIVIALAGWRSLWFGAAVALTLFALPLLRFLMRHEPLDQAATAQAGSGAHLATSEWTRSQVFRDPLFLLLLPGIVAVSFMITGVFFHQVLLVEIKGWSLSWWAASYPVYAVVTVASSLTAGWIVDRWSCKVLLGPYLLPMGLAFLLLSSGSSAGLALVFMLLAGFTTGANMVLMTALWAELYGTRHIGAIRGLVLGALVSASAASPGIMGWLVDVGVGLDRQFSAFGLYTFAVSLLFIGLVRFHPRLSRPAKSCE